MSMHIGVSILLSLWAYQKAANLFYPFMIILGGNFIDLDHFVDYFIFFKNRFKLKEFLRGAYLRSGKVYLLLHSWEMGFVLFLLSLSLGSRPLMLFSLSLSLHLAIDNAQRKNPLVYFLIYRFSKGFDALVLFPELIDD
ncbi:MAG: hypothetical protein FJZ13_03750 [Candidatus Omnitrophica bacterium]|nr:hypothetical protein [Candidatus Omnitrophota bacterium]